MANQSWLKPILASLNGTNTGLKSSRIEDYALVQASLNQNSLDASSNSSFKTTYKIAETNHLGQVSPVCLQYAELKDKVNTVENQ